MKKILAIIMMATIMLGTGAAYALNWTDIQNQKCEEYTIRIDKYIRHRGDVGAAYTRNPSATAPIGSTVYFDVVAVDSDGGYVDPELKLHDLMDLSYEDGLYCAKVVGDKPYVQAIIINKTDISNLWHNGMNIDVTYDSVTIGDLTFTRNEDGLVLDVHSDGSAWEMHRQLAALGISIDAIYNGKIHMSDDILISNFGRVCRSEASAYWYNPSNITNNAELTIPKTGDASIVLVAIGMACFAAALYGLCARRR